MEKEELKTLDDLTPFLNEGRNYFECFSREQLKAEAVKWVKAYTNQDDVPKAEKLIINWIKHFFNLTEEDLK